MRRDTFLKALAATAAASVWPQAAQAASPLKMMIPANPGGGWDTLVRTMSRVIQQESLALSSKD